MIKKLVALTITVISLAACITVAGVFAEGTSKNKSTVISISTTMTAATLKLDDNFDSGYISYSEDKNFTNEKVQDFTSSTVEITGLKPETTYYFKAMSRTGKAVSSRGEYISAKTEPVAAPKVDYTASSSSRDSLSIKFKKESDIKGYKLWLSDNKSFTNQKVTQGASSLKFNSLKPDTTYNLKAVSYVTVDGDNYFSDPTTFIYSTKALPKPTANIKASASTASAIRIEFNKIEGVKYRMRICSDSSFADNKSRIVEGGSSLRLDNLARPNHKYYIRAATIMTVNGKKYYSPNIVFTYNTKNLSKPTANLKASASTFNAIRIELNKTPDVKYRMRVCSDSSFANNKSRIVEGGSSLRIDNLASPNHKYYIRVVTFKTVDGKRYYSPSIEFTYNTKNLPKPTANLKASASTANAIRIELNKISGVKYRMRVCSDSSFADSKSRIVEGGSSLRIDNLKQPNHKYYIRVATFKIVNGKKIMSPCIEFTYNTKACPDAPKNVKVTNGMQQISWNTWNPQYTISWSGVSGATKYNVYESSSRNSGFKKVASVKGKSYTVTGCSIGDHYYLVKAVTGNAESKASAVCGIRYVGIFSTTGYCANYGARTADGSYCASNHTVAAGYAYAFGTYFKIGNHNCTYEVEDRGGAVSNSVIDIYFDSYGEACNWGRRWLPVYQIL